MSANIRTGCRYVCASTWRDSHGPSHSLEGTHAEHGDVRYCEHGRLWRYIGTRENQFFCQMDCWKRITRAEPIIHRRAIRALAAAESVGGEQR